MNRITTNITLHKCLFCCFTCAALIITLSHKLSGFGLSMLIRLPLPTTSFRRTVLNHFISKVVHDLFFFDVKFWQMDHVFAKIASAIFCLICHYVCAETTAVVLLALMLCKIKFSVPGFVHNLCFSRVLSHFGHF